MHYIDQECPLVFDISSILSCSDMEPFDSSLMEKCHHPSIAIVGYPKAPRCPLSSSICLSILWSSDSSKFRSTSCRVVYSSPTMVFSSLVPYNKPGSC